MKVKLKSGGEVEAVRWENTPESFEVLKEFMTTFPGVTEYAFQMGRCTIRVKFEYVDEDVILEPGDWLIVGGDYSQIHSVSKGVALVAFDNPALALGGVLGRVMMQGPQSFEAAAMRLGDAVSDFLTAWDSGATRVEHVTLDALRASFFEFTRAPRPCCVQGTERRDLDDLMAPLDEARSEGERRCQDEDNDPWVGEGWDPERD